MRTLACENGTNRPAATAARQVRHPRPYVAPRAPGPSYAQRSPWGKENRTRGGRAGIGSAHWTRRRRRPTRRGSHAASPSARAAAPGSACWRGCAWGPSCCCSSCSRCAPCSPSRPIAAVDQWRAADRLREFRSATRLSFASADAAEALANERTAATLGRLGVRSVDAGGSPRPSARSTRRCGAPPRRRARAPVDVAGRLQTARRRLDALRRQAAAGSLGLQEIVEEYGVIARGLLGIVRDLDSGRPSRATGRAATAYVALVRAVEGAEMERVTQAAALVRGTEAVRVRGRHRGGRRARRLPPVRRPAPRRRARHAAVGAGERDRRRACGR